MEPDEGRNAEIAREMAEAGDYLRPHLNGLPRADKPFLYFAAGGIAQRLLGATEFAARFPSVVFTLVTVIFVGAFASRVWGPSAGALAPLLMLSVPLVQVMSKIVIPDNLLLLLVTAAIMSFYFAIEAYSTGRQPRGGLQRWQRWSLCAWAAIGMGVLTKGPVALALPLLVALPYGLYRHAGRAVSYLPALGLCAVIVAPWVLLMIWEMPGYLHYVLVTEIWQRVATDELRRTEPVWFFMPILLLGLFPWSLVLIARACVAVHAGIGTGWRRCDHRAIFLLLWLLLPLLFFTLQHSKQPHYVLPVVPAAALLVVAGRTAHLPGVRGIGLLYVCIGLVLAVIIAAQKSGHLAVTGLNVAPTTLSVFALACIAGGVVAWIMRARPSASVAALSLPIVCLMLGARPIEQAVGQSRSARDLAAAIRQHSPAGTVVVGVTAFTPGLPFYLGTPILVATDTGLELTGNFTAAAYRRLLEAPGSTLRPSHWWHQALARCERPYVFVLRNSDPQARARVQAAGLPRIAGNRKFTAFGPCSAIDAAAVGQVPGR